MLETVRQQKNKKEVNYVSKRFYPQVRYRSKILYSWTQGTDDSAANEVSIIKKEKGKKM